MIRLALEKDIPKIMDLLSQVDLVHHKGRPDIFKIGTKYSVEELKLIIQHSAKILKVEIDENLLKTIAQETGGKYFRATDNTKLAEIYSEINKMEKARTTVDSFPVYKELFGKYALLALLALLLELLFNWFVIRRLP